MRKGNKTKKTKQNKNVYRSDEAACWQDDGVTRAVKGADASFPGEVGYMKPVGQQHVTMEDGTVVDKDVALFTSLWHRW